MGALRPEWIAARRPSAAAVLLTVLTVALTACTSTVNSHTAPAEPERTITTAAFDVSPFPPSNSAWYRYADLRARQPFARWDQERARIVIVTWPDSCAHVPTAITFHPSATTITVLTAPAPHRAGETPCQPGHVLTSDFDASRLLRRNRSTTLVLDHHRFTLPPAPPLVIAHAATEQDLVGDQHPLSLIQGPLPQYSVPDYPWTLDRTNTPETRDVTISWIGGSSSCPPNASNAYLQETATTVTIDIALTPPPIEPAPPAPDGSTTACTGVGRTLIATVHLTHPLGHRQVLQHRHGPRPADQNAY